MLTMYQFFISLEKNITMFWLPLKMRETLREETIWITEFPEEIYNISKIGSLNLTSLRSQGIDI